MKCSLASILLLTVFFASAQNDYLVTLDGDTLYGKIKLIQKTYYDDVTINNDDIKETFRAYQVKEVKLNGDLYDPITFNNKKIFGKRITKGKLSHYLVRPDGRLTFDDEVLLKSTGESMVVTALSFKKSAGEFFKDREQLSTKIDNKEFTFRNIPEIVNFYNNSTDTSTYLAPAQEDTNFSDLNDLAQLLIDILEKVNAKEEVPDYMVKALKEAATLSTDEKIEKLIEQIEKD